MNYVTDNLFLGSFADSANRDRLTENNILHIINVAKECDHMDISNDSRVTYHKIGINDASDITEENLEEVYNLITSFDGENTLIHCRDGKTRSVCFVLYYLMKGHNYNLSDSVSFLRDKRKIISPALSSLKLLSKFDVEFDLMHNYVCQIKKVINTNYSDEQLVDVINKNNYDITKIMNVLLDFVRQN